MPTSGPDWDGAVVKDNVEYPIGRTVTYPPPFIRKEVYEPSSKQTAFQSHFQNKVIKESSKSRGHATSKDNFDIIEDEDSGSPNKDEENEEIEVQTEEEETTIQKIYGGLGGSRPNKRGRSKSKKDKLKLNIVREERLDDIYPLLPNEVTAYSQQEMRNNPLTYYSHRSEYIIYNDALVRIRYIVQLSSKPKELLEKEQNYNKGFKTRGNSKKARKQDFQMIEEDY